VLAKHALAPQLRQGVWLSLKVRCKHGQQVLGTRQAQGALRENEGGVARERGSEGDRETGREGEKERGREREREGFRGGRERGRARGGGGGYVRKRGRQVAGGVEGGVGEQGLG
jgi:hypothetical protein